MLNTGFCFASLALGRSYRDMAKLLASDLARFAPDQILVIATDAPEEFAACANVRTLAHRQVGLFRCINDKRFAISFALANYAETVIFIDADTRVIGELPGEIRMDSPIATVWTPNLAEHAESWLGPKEKRSFQRTARAFGSDPATAKFIWDNLFAVRRDQGRERVFLQIWGLVTQSFDFQGANITDGYCMSIAASVVGWNPSEDGLQPIDRMRLHAAASSVSKKSLFSRLLSRVTLWWRWRKWRSKMIASLNLSSRSAL
jgi:hypothetical protein